MKEQRLIDEFVATTIFMFMVSCVLSFLSMGSSQESGFRFGKIADLTFHTWRYSFLMSDCRLFLIYLIQKVTVTDGSSKSGCCIHGIYSPFCFFTDFIAYNQKHREYAFSKSLHLHIFNIIMEFPF